MKKFLLLTMVISLLLLGVSSVYSVNSITLEDISPAQIHGADTLESGTTYTLTLRLSYTDGPSALGGMTNGFRVFVDNDGNSIPDPGGTFFPLVGDTLSFGWDNNFTVYTVDRFGIDGIGSDTIGLGGLEFGYNGLPVGFNEQAFYFEIGSDNAGDILCLDSTFYPPGGGWLWAPMEIGADNIYPIWGGPYCFYIYSPNDIRTTPGDLPETYTLNQNYPNPFNPTTEIHFDIPTRSHTTLKVYNILGQEVETLIDKEMSPGRYVAEWDASQYSSGVYFYKIDAEGFVDTKKMVLVK